MKTHRIVLGWLRVAWTLICGLLWWLAACVAYGQTTNYLIDQFDTDTTGAYANQRWGTAVPIISWDSAQNATSSLASNHTGSGSAKWVIPWTTTGDQIMVIHAFGANLDLNQFVTVSFDIHFGSVSATDGAGSYGAIELDWIPTADNWPSTGNPGQAIISFASGNTNWVHVSLPISAASVPKLSSVSGIGFKMQQSRTGENLTGVTTFWIDNILLSRFTGPAQVVQLNSAQVWQRLEFLISNTPSATNPFDPNVISLDATFTLPSGRRMTVPAFWYQGYQRSLSGGAEYDSASGAPQWRLRFLPPEPGAYALSVVIQTNQVCEETVFTNFTVASNAPLARFGYVGIAPGKQYFQTGEGQALPLNGEDVAWPSSKGTYDYDNYFASMHNAGENFARVWMAPWSLGIEDAPGTLDNYAQQPAWQLDYILQLAEQKSIYLQLTLVWHGMFETQPDYWGNGAYWPQNPYNSANGGPCANQDAFFTNTTAKTLYQKRLRYLVGRYGYSQNLLAWEFFNEIDNEYAYLNSNDVAAWHRLMGTWLHTNDPFGHLETTSLTYASSHPELWNLTQMDYCSEHAYTMSGSPLSIASDSQYFLKTYGKPIMIGEFGTSWMGWNYTNSDPYLRGFREGIWAGALGGSAGTSMSWWWDSIPNYSVYSSLTTILGRTGWGHGTWTNITFQSGQSVNAIGLSGAHESLIYLVAAGATFPNGAASAALSQQQGLTVTLANWPAGRYYAEWYDPASGALVGGTQATTANGRLTLSLPGFSVDLAGIVYPPPTLVALGSNAAGNFQFRFSSETGGRYTILKSSDLLNWSPAWQVTNAQGTMVFTNPAPITSGSPVFFRAGRAQ